MLGYFSLVGLLRLHSLLGDYYQAIKVLENIELNKKVRERLPDGERLVGVQRPDRTSCPSEHVLPRARVPDHHLLLRRICLPDDAALPGCHPSVCQHPALHPEDEEHVPEVNLQI